MLANLMLNHLIPRTQRPLQILTRSMPLSNEVNLDSVADLAVGMVGADLKAVTQKAVYIGLRRQVPSLNDAMPDNLLISQDDFLLALRDIKPSVLRSVEVESPKIAWDDIGGLDDIKQTLQESVEGTLLYPDLYAKTGARAPRGVLLWGPPRTGKTLLAKAIASQAKANFIAVNGPKLMSRWVGSAERSVRRYRAALTGGMTDGVTAAAIVITQADFALAYGAIVIQRESST